MSYFFDRNFEVVCKLLDISPENIEECELIDDLLMENWGIEYQDITDIITKLLPLCGEGKSELSDKYYIGFCDRANGEWLSKMEYDEPDHY